MTALRVESNDESVSVGLENGTLVIAGAVDQSKLLAEY